MAFMPCGFSKTLIYIQFSIVCYKVTKGIALYVTVSMQAMHIALTSLQIRNILLFNLHLVKEAGCSNFIYS